MLTPVPLSSFVGREAELELGRELLGRVRLLTITGPGGAGKTRLALELARQGAVAFCDLSPALDAESAQAAMASALEVEATSGGAGRERIVRRLRDESGLLVIDNCEQVIDAAAELVESVLVAAPGIRVLATSQEPLALPGETLLRLGALSDEDGRRLFVERIREGDPRYEPDSAATAAIGEICRRLDAIPLALELAAARARTMPLEDLLAGLQDRFAILRSGSRRAPSRQQTLEAAVTWSYGLLGAEERALFDRIAVLPGRFQLAAVEAVAEPAVPKREVPLLLSRLGDRSLIELVGDRYRMPETLRAFGRDRLQESGQLGDVLLAAAVHYDGSGASRTSLGLSQAALAELDPADARRADLVDRAASQAERVGRYDIGSALLLELRGAEAVATDAARLANVEMRYASAVSMATGDIRLSLPSAEHALEIYRRIGDPAMVLQAEVEVAWLDGLAGHVDQQLRRARDVVERAATEAPESDAHLHALGCAGLAEVFLGRLGAGRELLQAGIRMARAHGDTYQLGWFTGVLAYAIAWADGPRPALKELDDIRSTVEEHLDPVFAEGEINSLLVAGSPAALVERVDRLGDLPVDWSIRGGFLVSAQAAAAAELGHAARAEELLGSAHRLFADSDIYYQRRAHNWLEGVVRWCGGAPAEAAQLMLRAGDLLTERLTQPVAAFAYRDAADAAWDAGEPELERQALQLLDRAAANVEGPVIAALAQIGTPAGTEILGRHGCFGLRARSLEREGKFEAAAAAYEELGMRYRADRALARLRQGGGAEATPTARRLARLVLFDGLSAAELEPLAGGTVRQSFAAGERLHSAEAAATAVFAIDTGHVRLTSSAWPAETAPMQAGPGELLGERALIPGESYVTDATAAVPTEALRIDPAALLAAVREHPALAERLVALVHQRVRQESSLAGSPEPPDVAARVLGALQLVAAAAGDPQPAFELLPVYLVSDGPWLLRPSAGGSWLVEATPGQVPAEVIAGALAAAGCQADIVHSTSWRFDQGRLVLTYLAIMPGAEQVAGMEALPVRRAELARGSAKGAPGEIRLDQVVEHGLRHLSWLSRDDPVIKEELSPAWLELVAGYQPEPFRAL
ncbi:MAG TPA: cyclic nucleotide-binding domain-containing protein [Candidatus Dormibacteraeota bacterium]